MGGTRRRLGKPRTLVERKRRHKARFGTLKNFPKRRLRKNRK